MPIPASAIGNACATPRSAPTIVDTRWLLAYAAAIGDGDNPRYMSVVGPAVRRPTFDFHTSGMQGDGVMAHPVFVWAVEWPMLWRTSALLRPQEGTCEEGLEDGEKYRALHYSEEIIIHRPIAANDEILTECSVCAIRRHKRGTFVQYRFEHRLADTGERLCTSWNGTFWPGVHVSADQDRGNLMGRSEWTIKDRLPMELPYQDESTPAMDSIQIPIGTHLGIIYSECSRIWNPIHSDPAAAAATGLEGPVLHGTATLAKCVSALVRRFTSDNDPSLVQRVSVRQFDAPVMMPSLLTVDVVKVEPLQSSSSLAIHFVAKTDAGGFAIRGGGLILDLQRENVMHCCKL